MKKDKPSILITGAAGFIGSALAIKLLEENNHVIGIDNINNYYSTSFKKERLSNIIKSPNSSKYWNFHKISIENKNQIFNIFEKYRPKIVVNLAAQAGVRYSLENPEAYIKSNLVGFFNILEACKSFDVENFIYASSSSVYGGNKKVPFKENDSSNHPISLYAATKRSNELMAHSYSHLYDIPSIGLRFFTVYGPWGRPDMAPMIFANAIMNQLPINIFNFGKMKRDFTYIDDVVESIKRCCFKPATVSNTFDKFDPENSCSFAKHRIFNVGNSKPVELEIFIELLEDALGKKAIKKYDELQKGDVISTLSDTSLLTKWIDFTPSTSIQDGILYFAKWFENYYEH
ncbi:NAD-dependent epimerase/dehydratase family protein [Prochlorococcus marinus]|jgi:UDP-glucuronate 4-epimerase|uniref:Putative nucleotide sugar epimerase n=1 Tax=Prochlorococcus marinus (strain MIT 9301) TaxID=167546 RepID=A3PE47_PROM0|nr:NAD-dependent epimerase/dehydratase family protein [Prochlorococcus marinus]ABO18022.1 putative nucleotide sugar epimerase [Prochlorococcus marinus str. MIT 9301]